MKKIVFLLSLVFICSVMQVSAMKRPHEQITEATDSARTVPSLPDDMIIRIATSCDPEARTLWSSLNRSFNKLTSIRNTEGDIAIDKADRLYYLFYGCIHDLKNLVTNALKMFNTETDWSDQYALEKATYYIKKMTQSEATKLLPDHPYEDNTYYDRRIFDFIADNKDVALFELCIKNPTWNNHKACKEWVYEYAINEEDPYKEHLCMLKIAIIHNRHGDALYIPHNLAAMKLFWDYDKAYDINRHDKKGNTSLHLYIQDETPNICFEALLKYPNINVNIQNENGDTPLHLAIGSEELELVNLLLAHHEINFDLKDNEGDTPLQFAINNLHRVSYKFRPPIEVHGTGFQPYIAESKIGSAKWLHSMQEFQERVAKSNKAKHAIVAQLLLAQGKIKHVQDYPGM